MEAPRAEEIVWPAVRSGISPEPRATQSLRRPLVRLRPRAAESHADWRALPRPAIAALFLHLPVLDLFLLGHLFTSQWLEVWRGDPLELHDVQFARLPIPRSHVADAIGNVLDKYLAADEDEVEHEYVDEDDGGGDEGEDCDDELEDGDDGEGICGAAGRRRVESFRVESTEWRAEHAARWCAALKRGGADEVILFNRGDPPVLARVPPGLLECVTVTILHLGFFTVEAGELDALTETIHLGLYGCACRPGVVEGVVGACRKLHKLWIQDCSPPLEHVVVSSAPRLWRISMLRTAARSLAVHNAPILHEIVFPAPGAMVSIRGARWLRRLISLDVPTISLEIDGEQIPPQPQSEWLVTVWSVTTLVLAVDYAALGGAAMAPFAVEQMLRPFPYLKELFIKRKDEVSEAEGLATRKDPRGYQHLFDCIECVARELSVLNLVNFQGGKAEVALARAILYKARALKRIVLTRSGAMGAFVEADQALLRLARPRVGISHQPMSSFETTLNSLQRDRDRFVRIETRGSGLTDPMAASGLRL